MVFKAADERIETFATFGRNLIVMRISVLQLLSLLALVCCSGCTFSIDREKLNGTWNYEVMQNLHPSTSDTITAAEMRANAPFIRFSKSNELTMIWGGKTLSQGTFRIEGKMIRYKEALPGGTFREFPFLVSRLTDDELVFETMARESVRVKAVRKRE